MSEFVLEMIGIAKHFPGVVALKNVDLRIKRGTVHGLMGENGAGKSTLMKCLIGIHPPTTGKIILSGNEISIKNPNQATTLGISMIHQELNPVPERSIMENVWLGKEPTKYGIVDHAKMYIETKKLFEQLNLDIDPKAKMNTLTVAKIQMIEIVKAISQESSVVIMDEPTSALTNQETEKLFEIIAKLKEKGVSIIYISHKMDEIFRICDEITVLRDGSLISTNKASELTMDTLISKMVGRNLDEMFPKVECPIGDVVLEVSGLSCGKLFDDVSFTLRKGEILGFSGLIGAGRTEVMETVFGLRRKTAGTIKMNGKVLNINNSIDAKNNKIALLTEDRRATGIMPVLTIASNMSIASLKFFENSFKILSNKKIIEHVKGYKDKLSIKMRDVHTQIQNLSGGNQQKVLFARWLLTDPDILILDEPTRGIDVMAKSEIHAIVTKLAASGKSIIMISSEMPEVLGMSDRIVVMREGKISGIVDRTEATQEVLMRLASV